MEQQQSTSPLRILYVEDNKLIREITCELLLESFRQVTAVATAEEALNAFSTQRFDLVTTDVNLPAMSGIELARQIQRLDPSVPIILASGYTLDPSCCGFGPKVRAITKPVDPHDLEVLIQELCDSGPLADDR